ncbi:MAG: NfeD family protein, partial [Actinomycetota bacterium]
ADAAVSNLPALLNELDGRKVFVQGKPVVLPRQPFTLRFHKMALGPRLLHSALRPSIAYVLIIIGVFGFIFELYHPGIGAAAISGALSLGFGLYAMTVMPANWWAVMLLMASLGLFLIELHRSSLGRYSLAGTAAFFVATFNLFSGPDQVFDLKWWVVAEAVGMIALFYFFIMPAAFRSQLTPAPDVKPLLGMAAVAETDVSPMGKVNAGGSTWDARTFGAAIPEGAPVVVKGASGSVLIVEESRGA